MSDPQTKLIEKGLSKGQKYYPTTRTIVGEFPKFVNGVLCKDADEEKAAKPAKTADKTDKEGK